MRRERKGKQTGAGKSTRPNGYNTKGRHFGYHRGPQDFSNRLTQRPFAPSSVYTNSKKVVPSSTDKTSSTPQGTPVTQAYEALKHR